MKSCGGAAASAPNPWEREFTLALSDHPHDPRLPELALSSTALGSGQPVMQTTFTLQRTDSFDILDPKLATRSLTLAQAVHNSARFPYVSPAGVVKLAADQSTWDRLGDGGYVEASGTLTLGQIIESLADQHLIRAGETPATCDADCHVSWDQVRILILDNTPTYGGNLLCGAPIPGDSAGKRVEEPQNTLSPAPKPWPPGPDFVEPPLGSLSTGGGRSGQCADGPAFSRRRLHTAIRRTAASCGARGVGGPFHGLDAQCQIPQRHRLRARRTGSKRQISTVVQPAGRPEAEYGHRALVVLPLELKSADDAAQPLCRLLGRDIAL